MNSKKYSLDRKNTISHKMSFHEFNLLSMNSIVTVVQKQVLVIGQEDVESESAGYLAVFRITSLYVGGRLSETVRTSACVNCLYLYWCVHSCLWHRPWWYSVKSMLIAVNWSGACMCWGSFRAVVKRRIHSRTGRIFLTGPWKLKYIKLCKWCLCIGTSVYFLYKGTFSRSI